MSDDIRITIALICGAVIFLLGYFSLFFLKAKQREIS